MSVIDAVALADALGLGVRERVDALHCLRQVARHVTHYLEKLVLIQTLTRNPESYVFVASRELRIRLELSDLTLFELVVEAWVLAPEQSDVLYVEEFHGPAFESEAERPADLGGGVFACVGHDSVVDDARAEDLQPVVVVEDLQLDRGLRKWEISWHPTHLHVPKDRTSQVLQYLLEISFSYDLSLGDIFRAYILDFVRADAFHLMERRVVRPIDRVLSVDVPHAQECRIALATHQLDLMHASVRTQAYLCRFVVGICSSSADVILGYT